MATIGFVLDGLGYIRASVPSGLAAEIRLRPDGRWAWAVMRGATPHGCGASHFLDHVIQSCIQLMGGHDGSVAYLDLPCGTRVIRSRGVRMEEVMERLGYARTAAIRVYLGMQSRPDARAEDVRGIVARLVGETERSRLGAVELAERSGVISCWCVDMAPVPYTGYLHPERLGEVAATLVSANALRLMIHAEAEPWPVAGCATGTADAMPHAG